MDVNAWQARDYHRSAGLHDQVAARYRDARDRLIRQLRAQDPARWTYQALATAVEVSPELVAAVVKGRRRAPEPVDEPMPVTGPEYDSLSAPDRLILTAPDLRSVLSRVHDEAITTRIYTRAQVRGEDDPGYVLLGESLDQPVTVTACTLVGADTGRVHACVSRRRTTHVSQAPWVHSWLVGVGAPSPFGAALVVGLRPGHPVIRRTTVHGHVDAPEAVETVWWPAHHTRNPFAPPPVEGAP